MKAYRIISILPEAVMITVASVLLLSSCAKELGDKGSANGAEGAPLSFSAGTSALIESRAAVVTSVSEFYTMGYDGSTQWFPDPASSTDPEHVVIPIGATFDTFKWVDGANHTFYGYANMPESADTATVAIASTGVTLNYKAVPATASAQKDILLGLYSGDGGGTGTAAMAFYHPLAQVVFERGDMVGVSRIDKIKIRGVYGTGTTTLSTGTTITDGIPQFEWTGSGFTMVSQDVGSLPAKGSEFGTPFMLIPQDLSAQNVIVSVTVTTTGGSSVTLEKKLATGSFATGRKTVCTLTVNPFARELGCSLASYELDTSDDIFPTLPPVVLPGEFSVSNDNGTTIKKVHFSRGNLQATYSTATSSYTWGFAKNQYDYIGNAAGNTTINSQTDGAVIDLFGWVGESSTSFTSPPQIYGISTSKTYADYGNSSTDELKADWGTAIDDKGTWRTLSSDEWVYLFDTRAASTVSGTADARYAKATVDSKAGMILLPDEYTHPSGVTDLTNINTESADFTVNTYDSDAWKEMESAGAVFLPSAGNRSGSSVIIGAENQGRYWSSSVFVTQGAYILFFSNSKVYPRINEDRYRGESVRLITESK